MKRYWLIVFPVILLLLSAASVAASGTSVKTCSVCGRKMINRNYYTMDNKIFCSDRCLDSAMPHCRSCGRVLRGKYITFQTDRANFYCPECASLPRCFVCQLPGRTEVIYDGRRICPDCRKNAVVDHDEARRLFNEVKKKVAQLGFPACPRLSFFPVGKRQLSRILGTEFDTRELGLYRHEVQKDIISRVGFFGKKTVSEKIISDRCAIYIYDWMDRARFCETAAHELAHDWMEHHYPRIKSDWIREGFAEYVASLYNKAVGNGAANWRMNANTDTVYGGGYRKIKAIADQKGMKGLLDFLKTAK